jgi:hypothetical protein
MNCTMMHGSTNIKLLLMLQIVCLKEIPVAHTYCKKAKASHTRSTSCNYVRLLGHNVCEYLNNSADKLNCQESKLSLFIALTELLLINFNY